MPIPYYTVFDKKEVIIQSFDLLKCRGCSRPVNLFVSARFCSTCFINRKKANNKYSSTHKEAVKKRLNNWYIKNKDHVLEYNKKYRAEHKDKVRIWNSTKRKTLKGIIGRKKYEATHKETIRKGHKKWRDENKERYNSYQRRWRLEHPKKATEYTLRWKSLHKEQASVNEQKRRVLKAKAEGTFSALEWETLIKKYNHCCIRCGKYTENLTVDHIVPLVSGGTNYIDNIQPLCMKCNCSKGKKTVDYRKGFQSHEPISA